MLLHTIHVLGVRLRPMVTYVEVEAPAGVLTAALRQAIGDHQAALLDLVEEVEERAAIAEYCGGLAGEEAERLAWQCVLGEEATTERTEGYALPVGEVAGGVPVSCG